MVCRSSTIAWLLNKLSILYTKNLCQRSRGYNLSKMISVRLDIIVSGGQIFDSTNSDRAPNRGVPIHVSIHYIFRILKFRISIIRQY